MLFVYDVSLESIIIIISHESITNHNKNHPLVGNQLYLGSDCSTRITKQYSMHDFKSAAAKIWL